VRALLHYSSLVDHHNLIRGAHGGQAVGDGDERLALCQFPDGRKQGVLVFRVYAGGGLIQDDNGGVLQNRSGDGNPLLFPARKGRAALSDNCIVAVRQRCDEVVAAGAFGRLHHLLMGGVGFPNLMLFSIVSWNK
jgi:hypothetical protein